MKRVFISFRVEDRQQVNGLRLLAANPNFEIEFYDESVRTPIDSTNEAYIRQRIRERINRTIVTLCMLSELTHTSQWVCWELDESIKKGSTVICMAFPNGPDRLIVPEPARNNAIGWHRWDIDDLHRRIQAAS
jgi:hypothetical protein